ncbi:MAG: IS630 family transposase [Verrucomicrobiota bacterium]|nr:IS630 family transposase [Verrucomicrobiota bacterium]
MEPALQEAKDGNADVYFVDAAHFILGAFLAILWSFQRLFIKTSSGRKRLNVLGALNAVTHEMITVVNDAYINAWSVVDLMRKIREKTPTGKIVLVLDNARYQACYVVRSAAHMMHIELLYLPPYSPNLNLIERVWKFIRKKCLNCVYHQNFEVFSKAINGCISSFGTEHKEELATLPKWNFQTFASTGEAA